ncbi:MAG: FAD-dependent oxidoreductase [Acidimicrobiales bacterium]
MSQPAARTAFDRATSLKRLAADQYDVLVIGGGITGAGVALDAAARGLRTALVEKDDFASGTSSKSSKLIHGGLRYLQQKEYRLVYENLAERQRLLENAPHLVSPLPFLIPLFGKDGAVNKAVAKAYRTALWLYDLTGGVRIGRRHSRVTKEEVLEHFPTLRTDRLVAGFLYWDARADDARLTLAVLRTAVLDHGAVAVNHAPVTDLISEDDTVTGARLADGTQIRAAVVVNATGVWSDEIRAMAEGSDPDSIRPAKGVHITVPRAKLPCDIACVVPVPKDRRSIFVVPWGDEVYLGTTDTDYDGPLDDPRCTEADVRYIVDAINTFITAPIEASDVVGTWAGLRPLVKETDDVRTADLSRRHKVMVSGGRLVTITGGKLTTYRKMAADTVDTVVDLLPNRAPKSATKKLRLVGAVGHEALTRDGAAARLGTDAATLDHLVHRYGTEARVILAMIEADPDLGRPLVNGLPYLRAEAVFAARYEMAMTVTDVLSRRTRGILLDRDGCAAAADDVARLLAPELGWTADEATNQAAAFRAVADAERQTATEVDLELT